VTSTALLLEDAALAAHTPIDDNVHSSSGELAVVTASNDRAAE
jgi:hypothetical protein